MSYIVLCKDVAFVKMKESLGQIQIRELSDSIGIKLTEIYFFLTIYFYVSKSHYQAFILIDERNNICCSCMCFHNTISFPILDLAYEVMTTIFFVINFGVIQYFPSPSGG